MSLALALHLGERSARADPPEDAGATFSRGLACFEAKDYACAIDVWEGLVARLGEDKAYKALYNLGLAYEGKGDKTRALERFDGFLRHIAEQTGALGKDLEERRQDAAERVRAIKRSHGVLKIFVKPGAPRVLVEVGDPRASPAREAGFSLVLPPGPHVIVAREADRAARFEVELRAGEQRDLDVTPAPRPVTPIVPVLLIAPTPIVRESPPSFPKAPVIVLGALTVASFALPIGLGLRAAALRSDATALGPGHTAYRDAFDRYASARSVYTWSYLLPSGLAATTIAFAIAGVVKVTAKPSVALVPTGQGVWLTGSF